jgi:N-acetylglucosamine kinase-like BadF-type ATPase
MNCYIGFDGGGTKTDCVALDSTGRIVGHGKSGPSNPLRVGYDAAGAALQMAAGMALLTAKASAQDVRGVCAGLAGAGRRNVGEEMRARLSRIWSGARVQVITDAEAALETAVGNGAGVVLIAGTGSIAMGRNMKGDVARAGGYGQWIGDAGSAYDIGRRSVRAACRARDFAAPATSLSELIPISLECRTWDEVIEKIVSKPGSSFPKLVRAVTQAAGEDDPVAREILTRAALDLGNLALTVIGRLEMKDATFRLARTGGVFGRSSLLDGRVDELIARVVPGARIILLEDSPALGAAHMALRQTQAEEVGHARPR